MTAKKTIYLLRHAKSVRDDPGLADFDRPLAPRGRSAAKTIAKYLKGLRPRPALVLCSAARRTCETLAALKADLDGAVLKIENGLYLAALANLEKRLKRLPDAVASVLVIGHNPGLEMLAFRLTDPRAKGTDSEALERMKGKFPTAGLAILELPARSWQALEPASCRLIGFVRPRDLER
ncbi:MAG: histidine phosphatase family protein [Rhodospirillales bacterium]|nr:histidine phosphatase family protein [Rhodospirillales bacterium]